MLRTTLKNKAKRTFRTRLFCMEICNEGDHLIICKHCGFFIVPLSAVSHYINIDIDNYMFGNHFLAVDKYSVTSLSWQNQPPFLHTEDPFLLMHIQPVSCAFCKENLGLFFLTANINKTEWLLDHVALNMEKVELNQQKSLLMHNTINQLHGELTRMEIKKAEEKAYYSKIVEKERRQQKKVAMVKLEKQLQKLILSNTDISYPQNKKKGKLTSNIISSLAFFDRETQKMEKQCKSIISKSEDLKLLTIEKYEEIQRHKIEMLKRRDSFEKGM